MPTTSNPSNTTSQPEQAEVTALPMAHVGRFNFIGFQTLLLKEIRRFTKVWMQTVLSPLMSTALYFLIFGVALGSRLREVDGVPYIQYVVPGLVMMSMINASFLNTSSSLFQSKINGTINDILIAPLGWMEILSAYIAAAAVRAFVVGGLVWSTAAFFIGPQIHNLGLTLFFALTVVVAFALLGLVVALHAQKFDHLAVIPSFVLTPLTFLGGVFYSVDMLPEPWSNVATYNPILHMVSGLRHGMLGTGDVNPATAAVVVLCVLAPAAALTARTFARGTKLRS